MEYRASHQALPPYFTIPENPIKARDNSPAVISERGNPFMPFGVSVRDNCSRIPAINISARVNPVQYLAAYNTLITRL